MSKVLRSRILFAMIAVLALPVASAEAETVTIGSPLSREFEGGIELTAAGSWANLALPEAGARTASPIAGTVVRWRVRGAFEGGPFMLQVLRPAGGTSYASVATSAPETPSGRDTQVFPTDLPIQSGDVIAIETTKATDVVGVAGPALGVNSFYWIPALEEGAAAAPPHALGSEYEVGFNADVESVPPVVLPTPSPTPGLTSPPNPTLTPAPTCTVPKLKGKSLKAARNAIIRADCDVGRINRKKGVKARTARVVGQSSKPGTVLPARTALNVTLGKG